MPQITTYLTFNGNCREAMSFYKDCIGGELALQTMAESPLADKMPENMKQYIVHATLTGEGFSILGSDMVDRRGLTIGNSVSMMLNCGSESELNEFYERLSAGGTADHPVHTSFWGALFGDLTDRYGNHWLLHYDRNNGKKLS